MNADERRSEQERMRLMTEKVIGCAFTVSNTLGCGFLEKVYENALAHELRQAQSRYPAGGQRLLNICVHPRSSAVSYSSSSMEGRDHVGTVL